MKLQSTFLVLVIGALAAFGLEIQTPPAAKDVLNEAKARATAEHKAIFVHFSASWCGWCKRLEAFLESKEIRPVFEKYFVDVKLDVQESDRNKKLENPGADAVLKQLGGPAGLPYHAFLDAKGQLIVNSNRPGSGNIGYPVKPHEIEWFLTMVRKAAPGITESEIKILGDWLKNQP